MSNDTLSLFNTLTGRVEPVRPIEDGKLRFYSCGPTVYSYAHIGNFRSFLTADLIVRTGRALGWDVHYVTNVTDVGHLTDDDLADASGEDRMAKALKSEEGRRFANVYDLARYYTDVLLDDWRSLNLKEPTVRPRATEHMKSQIEAVERLVEQGIGYETEKGVYFDISRFSDYGKLSGNRDAESLEQAVRDTVQDEEKRNSRDFALWKKDPGHLMQWYSPWGWGFPGWHIECSVMSMEYLGEQIDIHAGGEDLIFPHHECEIAQSESLTGKAFARHWVHTRFLQVEGEKMSKSTGNFFTVRDLIAPLEEGGKGIDPMALRLALISGQYRKPYNFTFETLKASMKHVERLRSAFETARMRLDAADGPDRVDDRLDALRSKMLSAMLDDLNTPAAIAAAIEGAKLIQGLRENLNASSAETALAFLQSANRLLGIPYHDEENEVRPAVISQNPVEERVEELLRQRATARQDKDFERADQIREELDDMGIEVMDSPEGSSWRRKAEI